MSLVERVPRARIALDVFAEGRGICANCCVTVVRRELCTLITELTFSVFSIGNLVETVHCTLRTVLDAQVHVRIARAIDLFVAKERIRKLADGARCRLGRRGRCGDAEECERADSNRSSALCRERHEATVVPSTSQRNGSRTAAARSGRSEPRPRHAPRRGRRSSCAQGTARAQPSAVASRSNLIEILACPSVQELSPGDRALG